jgi:hypothetical protein
MVSVREVSCEMMQAEAHARVYDNLLMKSAADFLGRLSYIICAWPWLSMLQSPAMYYLR